MRSFGTIVALLEHEQPVADSPGHDRFRYQYGSGVVEVVDVAVNAEQD